MIILLKQKVQKEKPFLKRLLEIKMELRKGNFGKSVIKLLFFRILW